MLHISRRTFSSLLFVGIMICVGYVAAQQSPNQQPRRTQTVAPQSSATAQQQNDQLRDQLAELQMQVKDLQAAINDLRSQELLTGATSKETRQLVSDIGALQAHDREDLNSLSRTVDREDQKIEKLAQQVSGAMLQLDRVKTKVGVY